MLLVVRHNERARSRLGLAAGHVEVAIAHIANEAQRHVPDAVDDDPVVLDALKLMVCALADIREELRALAAAAPRRQEDAPREAAQEGTPSGEQPPGGE